MKLPGRTFSFTREICVLSVHPRSFLTPPLFLVLDPLYFTRVTLAVQTIPPPSLTPKGKTLKEAAFDANHYTLVTDLVTDTYCGKGIHKERHQHCQLDDTVTFEDPAAICKSPMEVKEAFRALSFVKPKSNTTPVCINVEPRGSSIGLTYSLNQRYDLSTLISTWSSFNIKSHLFVEVQLIPTVSIPGESEFLITRFEERWNGIIPQNNYLLWITRRINGIVSWYITTTFLK